MHELDEQQLEELRKAGASEDVIELVSGFVKDAWKSGYAEGEDDSYSQGWDEGYETGYDQGSADAEANEDD